MSKARTSLRFDPVYFDLLELVGGVMVGDNQAGLRDGGLDHLGPICAVSRLTAMKLRHGALIHCSSV